MPTPEVPAGIPREAWEAAAEICRKMDHIRNMTYSYSQRNAVAEIITSHISKHRRMVAGEMEVGS